MGTRPASSICIIALASTSERALECTIIGSVSAVACAWVDSIEAAAAERDDMDMAVYRHTVTERTVKERGERRVLRATNGAWSQLTGVHAHGHEVAAHRSSRVPRNLLPAASAS